MVSLLLPSSAYLLHKKVRFNEDMMSLNYEPQHLKQAEAKLEQLFNAQEKTVLFCQCR